jgi:hypothetical protein
MTSLSCPKRSSSTDASDLSFAKALIANPAFFFASNRFSEMKVGRSLRYQLMLMIRGSTN